MDTDERIIAYFEGKLTEEEKIAFLEDTGSNPGLRKELLNCQNVRGILSLRNTDTDRFTAEVHYERLLQMLGRRMLWRRIRYISGYAAASCLLIAMTWTVARRTESGVVDNRTVGGQELYVPAGQRARITLPDGSQVWLNAGSTLRYPSVFDVGSRLVSLTGEAFFDVVSDKDRPFTVNAGKIQIEARGTKFNVHSYPDAGYASVALVEGKINAYSLENKILNHPLEPGQQIFLENGRFRMEMVYDKDDLLWKEGIYAFKKENIESIIKKLELYYDVKIVVKNRQLLKHEYTGKFRQRDGVMEILRILQKIHGFKIEKDEDLNQITIR